MYKVFIYNKPIFLIDKADLLLKENQLSVLKCNSIKDRDNILQQLKKNPRSIIVVGENKSKLKKIFFQGFITLEAAGGLVVNKANQILFIYRNGYWDLPKGKIEKGEKKKVAALREIEEECGISPVIDKKLLTTYHTYELGENHILKPTYWYLMKYDGDEELIPQEEEGITDVKWVNVNEMEEQIFNTFEAIKDVIQKFMMD